MPSWPETVQLLLVSRQNLAPDAPIFRNRYGEPLSASGVRFRLRSHLASANSKSTKAGREADHSAHVSPYGRGSSVGERCGRRCREGLARARQFGEHLHLRSSEPGNEAESAETPGTQNSRRYRKAWKQNPSLLAWLDSLWYL